MACHGCRLINLFGSQRAKRQLSAAQAAAITPENMGSPEMILKAMELGQGARAVQSRVSFQMMMSRVVLQRVLRLVTACCARGGAGSVWHPH